MTGSSNFAIRPVSGSFAGLSISLHLAVGRRHAVEHARRRRDQVLVELALEPLLDDLHVQQAEEAAAEAEAERRRRLRLEEERRVVQPQLLERLAQLRVLAALDRIEPGEDHRLAVLEAGKGLGRRPRHLGDRVADLRVGDGLDRREHEADLADAELGRHRRLRARTCRPARSRNSCPFAISRIFMPGRMTPSITRVRMMTPRYGVVPGVEDQRLERRVRIARRRRQPLDDRLEDLVDADAFLGAGENRVARVEADDLLDLPPRLVRLRARQIDLVDDRDDLEVVLDREVGVGQRLRLDALRRVDEQQRALARGERPRHLVGEVDVPGRVDQVEDVVLAVVGVVGQPDRVRLDGDAALALEVHAVEDLRLHLARLQRAGHLEKTVGQRRLAVVDVGDDGEVADEARIHVGGNR